MFKNSYVILLLLLSSFFSGYARQDENMPNNQAFYQNKFNELLNRLALDSAFLFLKQYQFEKESSYTNWKDLANAYWKKGNRINALNISLWLEKKTETLNNPNEIYPQLQHLIGNIYFSLSKTDSAIEHYKKSIAYREQYTDVNDTLLLDTYQNLSQIYSLKGDSLHTFRYLERAKDIVYLQTDNKVQVADIYTRIGDAYLRLRYYDLAEHFYTEAGNNLDAKNPKHQKAIALFFRHKATLAYSLGKYMHSINLNEKAFHVFEQIKGSETDRAKILQQNARSYYMLKDYENVIALNNESYIIWKKYRKEDDAIIRQIHTDLAAAYKGLEKYNQAIAEFRLAESNGPLSSYQYRVFGESLWKAKHYQEAEQKLLKANRLAEESKSQEILADSHFWLGSFYLNTGINKILGLYYLNRAVGEYRQLYGDKNEALGRAQLALAKYFTQTNNLDKALQIIQESIISLTPGFSNSDPLVNPAILQLTKQSVANSLGWKALALANEYEINKDINYLKASFETYQLSLKLVHSFRLKQKYSSNLILNKEVNALLDHAIQVSDKLYSLTKDSKYFEATFSFIEQNKSTALLASLQQNDSLRLSNVPVSLIQKENTLKQSILSVQEKIDAQFGTAIKKQNKLHLIYATQVKIYEKSLDSIQDLLRTKYPAYFRLFYGNNSISISEVQQQLSKHKVLVDYALTDTSLLVYVISKKQAQRFSKKKPKNLESSIRRLLQLLRKVNTDNSYSDYKKYVHLAFRNYQFLLGDFASQVNGKELLIVPDGLLSYLPFDALLTDTLVKHQPDYRALPYFIYQNVCSSLNSASIYFNYSGQKLENHGSIVAFAPNYSIFKATETRHDSISALLPLTHVAEELDEISTVFSTKIYKGKEATKANFLKQASQASVLHLAMHTVLNDKDPLRSELVFSPDKEKKSEDLFSVSELFGMELNADLAVLSACNSGNGKLNKGEGIMSLSTGFQYAGVPSIVMTHWDVNDKYSADLMVGFYAYLSKGLSKNKALHLAKIDLIRKGNAMYSHPYYWAGFSLIGSETPIVSQKNNWMESLQYIIPILILIGFFIRIKRK